VAAGEACLIVKRDIKNAFLIAPVAPHNFKWDGVVYVERCLPFGLDTALFLFNLFAEGLHWTLPALLVGW
jgi:hypothetical protein